ncbi:MAG: c-type cytochrome [Thiotrichales bacterium]|nr:c-type cytochrome [Thiotrichales bacterium]
MKKTLLLRALALGTLAAALSGVALAETGHHMPKAEAWSMSTWNQTVSDMPQGDAIKGADLHREAMCMTCHGDKGQAPSRNVPSLAGNTIEYNYKTLMDYQSGLRNEGDGKSAVMAAATHNLTKQDMADLAAYYAQFAMISQPAIEQVDPAIDRLVRKGDASRMIVPCASCHGAHGEGNAITPALAGQTAHYFVRTMQAYKHKHRTNDINEGMAQFTHDLTDAEIQALADYYASLNAK